MHGIVLHRLCRKYKLLKVHLRPLWTIIPEQFRFSKIFLQCSWLTFWYSVFETRPGKLEIRLTLLYCIRLVASFCSNTIGALQAGVSLWNFALFKVQT